MTALEHFMKGKKTFLGIGMLITPLILKSFDIEIAETETQYIIESVLGIIGAILAIYGRKVSEGKN